jgi:hypothetical protein
MLATEVTEVLSSVGAALAANNPTDRDEFVAKAAPAYAAAFTVIRINTMKYAFAARSVAD